TRLERRAPRQPEAVLADRRCEPEDAPLRRANLDRYRNRGAQTHGRAIITRPRFAVGQRRPPADWPRYQSVMSAEGAIVASSSGGSAGRSLPAAGAAGTADRGRVSAAARAAR